MRDETPLPGGRWSAGVVRIGDTVRRRRSPASAFVADLLGHVHGAGFHGCPRYLGRDHLDRDVFSYLPGEVVARWRRLDDAEVAAAARLLRQWHDATRGFRGGGVVCHHDPGPNNAVFVAGRPVAWIDFDFAAPGDPIEDVAYLAWSWCISGRPDRGPAAEQARQVRLLADVYGLDRDGRRRLVPAIDERLDRNVTLWRTVATGPATGTTPGRATSGRTTSGRATPGRAASGRAAAGRRSRRVDAVRTAFRRRERVHVPGRARRGSARVMPSVPRG